MIISSSSFGDSQQQEQQQQQEEYLVRDIIDYRPSDSHYLVRWVGYKEPTWEPIGCLTHCREALNDYIRLSKRLHDVDTLLRFEREFERFKQLIGTMAFIENECTFDGCPEGLSKLDTTMSYSPKVIPPNPDFLIGCTGCGCDGNSRWDDGTLPPSVDHSTPTVNTHGTCSCWCEDGNTTPNYDLDGKLIDFKRAIYECNIKCQCDPLKCSNRVIQSGKSKVSLRIVRLPDDRGWGVEAGEPIPSGTFIDRYHGEVITAKEAERRAKGGAGSYLFDLDWASTGDLVSDDSECEDDDIVFDGVLNNVKRKKNRRRSSTTTTAEPKLATKHHQVASFAVDAKQHGSVSRFFNHSCDPNLVVVPCFIECQDAHMHGVAFFAKRDIIEGEQLCFDYTGGRQLNKTGKKRPCLCGAADCKRFILI